MFFLSVIQSFHILLLNCIFHYSSLRYTSNKSLIRYKFHLFSRTMKEYGHRLFDISNLNRILNFHWFYLFLLPKSKTNWLCVFHSIQFYSISNEIVGEKTDKDHPMRSILFLSYIYKHTYRIRSQYRTQNEITTKKNYVYFYSLHQFI